MKTLADLKRDLNIGTALTLIESETMPEHRNLNKKRYIIKKNSVGVTLAEDMNATKGSIMDYPKKATLLDYDGEFITLYQAGRRPLTDTEREIMANVPSKRPKNAEAVYNEVMTDGSRFYYEDKHYYQNMDAEYLTGHETIRGLRYDYNTQEIIDETIKGKIDLKYKIN